MVNLIVQHSLRYRHNKTKQNKKKTRTFFFFLQENKTHHGTQSHSMQKGITERAHKTCSQETSQDVIGDAPSTK